MKKRFYVHQDTKDQSSLTRISNLVWPAPRMHISKCFVLLFFFNRPLGSSLGIKNMYEKIKGR